MVKKPSWNWIGPGIILAAAGVGAGDIVASGTAGATYGLVTSGSGNCKVVIIGPVVVYYCIYL